MRKKWDIIDVIAIILVLAAMVGLIYAFKPRPVVADKDDAQIGFILRYTNGEEEQIKEYDEDAILEYLESCSERRTLRIAGGFLQDDVDLEIYIQGLHGSSSKDILLGNINYSTLGGKWAAEYEIRDAATVKAKLLELLEN